MALLSAGEFRADAMDDGADDVLGGNPDDHPSHLPQFLIPVDVPSELSPTGPVVIALVLEPEFEMFPAHVYVRDDDSVVVAHHDLGLGR